MLDNNKIELSEFMAQGQILQTKYFGGKLTTSRTQPCRSPSSPGGDFPRIPPPSFIIRF